MAGAAEPPWEELHSDLRAFIGKRVRNQSDVDDLVQRVLLQMVRGLGSLREADRLHAWVYRAARNVLVDYYRSSSVRREVTSGSAEEVASVDRVDSRDHSSSDDESVALQELSGCLKPMLRQLPSAYRQAMTLTDLEGVTQAEAARRAGVSISGMKSRVQRGRKLLKAIVEECCRVQLDRRGTVVAYEPRKPDSCDPCGPGG
jgi:RNA polymerase sigma-70 factor (ECF subfamily)